VEALAATTASEAQAELLRRGYTLTVQTRVETTVRPGVGAHTLTVADRLYVEGPEVLPDDLRQAVLEHRDELLAAACVIRPPVPWLRVLVERYHSGTETHVRRKGWKGPCRVRLGMVAANVASFMGLHPGEDGPRLEPIIEEALR
jgi:hypothetical protein